jgi:hypothetical protein
MTIDFNSFIDKVDQRHRSNLQFLAPNANSELSHRAIGELSSREPNGTSWSYLFKTG